MVYTLDSILSNPAFITAVINRAIVTLNNADSIDWQEYLTPEITNPDGTFKTFMGVTSAVTVGSFIDKNSGKRVRKRQSMVKGYGEVAPLGESYQMDNDRLDRLQILVETLNRLGNQQAMNDIVNFLTDDFRQCVLAPHKRIDLMLNELKFNGQSTSQSQVADDAVNVQTITLPYTEGKNKFTPTAGAKDKFLSYIDSLIPILRSNGSDATIMEMNRATFRKFIVGCKEFSTTFKSKFGAYEINSGNLTGVEIFNRLFSDLSIPLTVRLKDVYLRGANGQMINAVPDNKIALLPNETIGYLRWRTPYEVSDPIPSKTYTQQENGLFIATERNKEGRFIEYGAEWIPDVNKANRMGLLDLTAFAE